MGVLDCLRISGEVVACGGQSEIRNGGHIGQSLVGTLSRVIPKKKVLGFFWRKAGRRSCAKLVHLEWRLGRGVKIVSGIQRRVAEKLK